MIFKSIVPAVDIPGLDLPRFVLGEAKKAAPPDSIAYHDLGTKESVTFRDLEDVSHRVASGLVNNLGIKRGDVVGIFASNHVLYASLFLGILSAGAACCTLSSTLRESELAYQVADSSAKAVFVDAAHLPIVRLALEQGMLKIPAGHVLAIDGDFCGGKQFTRLSQVLSEQPYQPLWIDSKWESARTLAAIIYSSGTTGVPKGVMLSHRNFIANMVMQRAALVYVDSQSQLEGTADSLEYPGAPILRSLAVLPFSHIYGLVVLITNSVATGKSQYILSNYSIDRLLAAIQKHKIEAVFAVPSIISQIAKHKKLDTYDLSSLRVIASGASHLPSSVHDKVTTRLPVAIGSGYGMSETSSGVTLMTRHRFVSGSVGFLFPGVEAKIIDPQTSQCLGYGQEGEICVRGDMVMMGYLNRVEETRQMIDGDGFLHTGDIGYISESNHVFITGRLKELIKYKGLQIPPSELEGILTEHPLVVDAGVIGVDDHERGTEVPKAFVTLGDPRKGSSKALRERVAGELAEWVASRVAPHKRLRGGVEIVSAIARNQTGKILRAELRAKHQALHGSKL
ncbi:4-coumarate--CoA ligase [Coemansia sp. IMI 209128]|nr:4-coumarate--CoA ligase [Coemansia sp. IMI 209128]